jgi:hypothetical protein
MKYLMAPIWLASFSENASVSRTSRATRCYRVVLKKVIGFSGFFRDGLMSSSLTHALVGLILIRMERGLFTVHQWDIGPQLFGTAVTAIANMKRNELAGFGVHGDPNPLLRAFLHKAPHLIGFCFQPSIITSRPRL